ncbi:peptidase s28 [Pyrenophora seminiperda CCB06]|uniref:Peptidase s28 n=1 Tax=Pyrenophora seminiperda CCB06 TaxID=1302712 RepID=A0A3M7M245_9PLEO|nr:peptidase s28 [Pyrenophora seminiperda CCB06]
MRFPTAIAALALALLPGSNAFFQAKQRFATQMAELGLKRDGSPVHGHRLTARDDPTVPVQYIELPLDHFGGHKGTFRNRYWVNTAGYKPGGPIFVYDMSETFEGSQPDTTLALRLLNDNAVFKQLIHDLGGIGILWENRGYGQSWNVPINNSTPPEAFEFLTLEQTLEDLVVFAQQFSVKGINEKLTPDQRPWIHYGGSAGAVHGSVLRNKRPDIFYAAWASSATSQAVVDFNEYFDGVFDGLVSKGFGNCTQDIKAVMQYIDRILDSGDETAKSKLKERFLGASGTKNPDRSFAESFAGMYSNYQAHGVDGDGFALRGFCDHISTDPATPGHFAPKQGWAATKGIDWTLSRWTSYAPYIDSVNTYFATSCTGNATASDCTFLQTATDPGQITYLWQTCTQGGAFQPANIGPKQLLPKADTLENVMNQCKVVFPTASLPKFPRVDALNAYTGGWNIRPSNTFFTYGELEPWVPLGVLSKRKEAPKNVEISEVVPKCGVSGGDGKVFGMVLRDQEHCFDVTSRVVEGDAVRARGLVREALRAWLKCFVKGKTGGMKERRWIA